MKEFFLFSIVIVTILAGCVNGNFGTLEGKITVGPICPVERIGMSCTLNASEFTSRQVVVQDIFTMKYVSINGDGTFSTDLAPGTYKINITNCIWLGCNRVLPKTVAIEANKTTTTEIDIDTGIR